MWRARLILSGLALTACSSGGEPQIWSTVCPPSFETLLYPNGTFIEAGDGRGRWRRDGQTLKIEVLQHPSVAFESLYPELISLDEDRVLHFLDERTLEAERGGYKKLFRRCQ